MNGKTNGAFVARTARKSVGINRMGTIRDATLGQLSPPHAFSALHNEDGARESIMCHPKIRDKDVICGECQEQKISASFQRQMDYCCDKRKPNCFHDKHQRVS